MPSPRCIRPRFRFPPKSGKSPLRRLGPPVAKFSYPWTHYHLRTSFCHFWWRVIGVSLSPNFALIPFFQHIGGLCSLLTMFLPRRRSLWCRTLFLKPLIVKTRLRRPSHVLDLILRSLTFLTSSLGP